MSEADYLLEGIVRDVLLQHMIAAFDAKSVLTVELNGDVVGDGPSTHLDLISVANFAEIQRGFTLGLVSRNLASCHLQGDRHGFHTTLHLDEAALTSGKGVGTVPT